MRVSLSCLAVVLAGCVGHPFTGLRLFSWSVVAVFMDSGKTFASNVMSNLITEFLIINVVTVRNIGSFKEFVAQSDGHDGQTE